MSEFFGQVGFFQLTNLVKNKVPFLLASFGPLEKSNIGPLNQILEKAVSFEPLNASEQIIGKHPDKGSPIVLLCSNGKASAKLAKELSEKGYLNVFVVNNGLEGLLIEATEGL
jgi:rhodanese-related sulfurtransferase